jgi:hypothetical protein
MPSPPPSRALPYGRSLLSARTRMLEKIKNKKIKNKFIFIFGSCCRIEKKERNFSFQFSVFNPQDPRAKPREEEGFFGLVPLVTHLYSSLGWLNFKVPKPFSPFSLRLIDVNGF